MHKSPSISVVIPTHNHASYIEHSLVSVSHQLTAPIEIIVSDDGSTDRTKEIVARFAGVKYLYQKNLGPSAARNHGVTRAQGDYILFLDADDVLAPEAIQHHQDCLRSNPDSALVSATFLQMDRHGNVQYDGPIHPGPITSDHYESMLFRNYIGMPGSAIIHRKSLLAIGGFDESLWACEDYDVYLKLCRNYKTAFHENIVAYYRITTTGLSMNGVRMLQKGNLVLDRQRPYISSNPQLVNACRAGRENFKNTYGRKIVFNAVQYIAKGELTSAASCISVLFTHSPTLAIKLIARGLRVFPRYMYSKLRNN